MIKRPGFSLIEIVIATGIIAIVASAFAGFMVNQQRELQRLEIRNAAMEISSMLRSSVRENSVCTFNFGGPPNTFDSAAIPAVGGAPVTQKLLNYTVIRDGDTTLHPEIVRVGQPFSNLGSVKVDEIYLTNWERIGVDEYRAVVQVVYSSLNNLGAFKPISIAGVKIATDSASPIASKVISDCTTETLTAAPPPVGPVGVQNLVASGKGGCCPRKFEMYSMGAFCWVRVHDNGSKYDDWQIDAMIPKGTSYNYKGTNYACP